jgi:hypothetical protein
MTDTFANFYGMITNIDENLGRFRMHLDKLGLTDNTLLIFMTDNGTTAGWIDQDANYDYFNAGMRGWKGSAWDGGHRVPCFWYWPKGGLTGGRDVPLLTAHIDMLPTLVDLLKLKKPVGPALDGVSLRSPLLGQEKAMPERTLFAHVQRSNLPPKWDQSAVMTERWRLVDGKELYDIEADPGQKTDKAEDHPEVVHKLRADYEAWWASLKTDMEQTVRYVLGGDENPMTLSSHDWLMPGTEQAAWHQNHIKRGDLINGPWAVKVKKKGTYKISLYRWAPYLDRAMNAREARLEVGDTHQTLSLAAEDTCAAFTLKLEPGPTMLQTWIKNSEGKEHGAYYVKVQFLSE